MIYEFKKQLEIGLKAEQAFLQFYKEYKKIENGNKGDFYKEDGVKVELKFDTRTTKQTPNIFIEKECHYPNKDHAATAHIVKAGGPWQARDNGVFYIVYMFADGVIYWLEVEALIAHLEENRTSYQTRTVRNRNFSGIGYLVPRDSVSHLVVLEDRIE